MHDGRLPPVLLLHGVCSTGATMRVLADAFRASGCRVLAPTLAAQRRTDVGALDGSLARLTLTALLDQARTHARVLAEESGEKPVIVGHSNGALLALGLAGLNEAQAIGLVAPAPPPSIPGAPLWLRRVLFARVFGQGWETRAVRFRPRWPFTGEAPGSALAETLCPDSGPAMAEALAPARGGPFDPPPPLPCPAVVVSGARDRLVPIGLTRSLAERFGADHRVLDRADHWLIGDPDHAATTADAVLDICPRKGIPT